MNAKHIYFSPATQSDADAIKELSKAFNCTQSHIVRFAMSEWLSDNFLKKLEYAQALYEVKETRNDSRQT